MNIIFIHGLNHRYEAYVWPWLEQFSKENGLNIIKPEFPNNLLNNEVYYEAWAKVFAQETKGIDMTDSIVVAHSLGNILAVKYFSENNLAPKAFIGLAGSLEPRQSMFPEQLNTFAPKDNGCEKFAGLIKQKYSLYSSADDDNYFSTKSMEDFADKIGSKKVPIANAGHFRSEDTCKDVLTKIVTTDLLPKQPTKTR